MKFHAAYVSTTASGDYYQALFEEEEDSPNEDSPYLLIQRQFEMSDGGRCYVETHNEGYIGHFRLRRIDFNPGGISIEIGRQKNNVINVTFALTAAEFEAALPVIKIISGEIDPYAEPFAL